MQRKILNNNKEGYLIIEVAFGLLIVAICAGIGYRFIQRANNHTYLELKTVCTLIAQTSMLAIQHQKDTQITLDTIKNNLITDYESFNLTRIHYGFLPLLYGPPTDPRKPIMHFNSFSTDHIKCSFDGSISHGTLYLLDRATQIQYAITIPIVPFGSLRIYKAHTAKKWELLSIEW